MTVTLLVTLMFRLASDLESKMNMLKLVVPLVLCHYWSLIITGDNVSAKTWSVMTGAIVTHIRDAKREASADHTPHIPGNTSHCQ